MQKLLPALIFLFLFNSAFAQDRGRSSYEFLDIPVSARITALGGGLLSVKDSDPALAAANPSLLNSSMHDKLVLSYINYFAGINYGYTSYTHDTKTKGTLNVGLAYFSYGSFDERDETGLQVGNFNAGEYALILGWGKSLDSSFSIGANFKTIYSVLYTDYVGLAFAADLSATYSIKEKRFAASFLIKNLGREVVQYNDQKASALPFEVQMGLSKQLENMPVRFSLVAHHLNQPDMTFDSPLDENNNSLQLSDQADTKNENTFVGNIFQHLIFNAEFIPSKNFNVRLGYNFNQRKEMILDNRPGTVGLSWGLGFKISKFHLSYGRSAYHLAGSPNHFTLTIKPSDFSARN